MPGFDPERILRALARHRVRFVLIGASAARLQGFPRVTAGADIAPAMDPENYARLASALRELNARVYTEAVPDGLAFAFDGASLTRATLWNLVTDAGRLDLVFKPSGGKGFDELSANAVVFKVFGMELLAASLDDILRSKLASARPQDLQDAAVIRQMLKRKR